jgi:polyhydroxyalkanoate synthase subunit PhaC
MWVPASSRGSRNPLNLHTHRKGGEYVETLTLHHGKLMQDVFSTMENAFDKFEKLKNMIITPPEVKVGQTPHETVFWKYNVRLQKYPARGGRRFETPIVITYALVNKPYIMDLLPGRSIIEGLVSAGFDVYLIDWGEPTWGDRDKGMDYYVNTYIDTMVKKVIELSGAEDVNLLGYCMGGTLSLIYTALNPEMIRNLILLATPFDSSSDEGILFKWAKEMKLEEIAETYGNCPGSLLAGSFAMLNPLSTLDKAIGFVKGIDNKSFVELFLAMEKWINDVVDVPGRMYTDFMKTIFQQNLLVKNQLILAGKHVELKNIECPFLNLVADQDTSVPPSSSLGIGDALSSKDKALLTVPAGHIGLAVSGKAQKKLWPEAAKWIAGRSVTFH